LRQEGSRVRDVGNVRQKIMEKLNKRKALKNRKNREGRQIESVGSGIAEELQLFSR
jgi:hypothetical protein